MDVMNKLTSRKFWICVAAFLGSIAASIGGLSLGNEVVAGIGVVCSVFSAAIYAAAEAYVDGASIKSETRNYEEKVTVTETSKGTTLTEAAAAKVTPTIVQTPIASIEETHEDINLA